MCGRQGIMTKVQFYDSFQNPISSTEYCNWMGLLSKVCPKIFSWWPKLKWYTSIVILVEIHRWFVLRTPYSAYLVMCLCAYVHIDILIHHLIDLNDLKLNILCYWLSLYLFPIVQELSVRYLTLSFPRSTRTFAQRSTMIDCLYPSGGSLKPRICKGPIWALALSENITLSWVFGLTSFGFDTSHPVRSTKYGVQGSLTFSLFPGAPYIYI